MWLLIFLRSYIAIVSMPMQQSLVANLGDAGEHKGILGGEGGVGGGFWGAREDRSLSIFVSGTS